MIERKCSGGKCRGDCEVWIKLKANENRWAWAGGKNLS